MAWWVIEDVALRAALEKVRAGDDPMAVEAELHANADVCPIQRGVTEGECE